MGEMRLLLDTHTLIWWTEANPRLSSAARAAIADPANEVHVSSISAVELAVKIAIGKLTLPLPLEDFLAAATAAARLVELPLSTRHAVALGKLPSHHRDPFDRLLVAQAQVEGMALVTNDAHIRQYAVPLVW